MESFSVAQRWGGSKRSKPLNILPEPKLLALSKVAIKVITRRRAIQFLPSPFPPTGGRLPVLSNKTPSFIMPPLKMQFQTVGLVDCCLLAFVSLREAAKAVHKLVRTYAKKPPFFKIL